MVLIMSKKITYRIIVDTVYGTLEIEMPISCKISELKRRVGLEFGIPDGDLEYFDLIYRGKILNEELPIALELSDNAYVKLVPKTVVG